MKTRSVLIVAAILTCSAVVIALLTGDESGEPPETGNAGPAGHERGRAPDADTDSRRMPAPGPADSDEAEERARPAAASTAEPTPPGSPRAAERRQRSPGGKRKAEPPGGQFNERVLSDLDYSPETIRFIRDLWERASADEAARRDRRDEYDWSPDDPRNTEIRDEMRSDLGDDLYDAMLYATNQPNRAQISNVIGTSPAAAAELRIKDVVVSYDGERIFHPEDLRRLTENAEPGRAIEVWIHRDGEDVQMFIEGGPLGVRYFPDWKTPTPE